ncbi:MerR family transcriptional regulator [Micromonospora sp. NPDC050397]|uniref:MerR family transcriptional regulator n=1 Tax=Micromonospora sp. NPDC050397 TaxID=3364279 RepID=UPI00384CA294
MRSSQPAGTMSIGELATRTGVAAHVLRHWETAGLVAPARVNGVRRYTEGDLVRIGMIRRAKAAQLSLAQIAALIVPTGTGDSEQRRAPLRAHLADLDRRAEELRIAREMVAHAIDCDQADLSRCPAAREIASRAAPAP